MDGFGLIHIYYRSEKRGFSRGHFVSLAVPGIVTLRCATGDASNC
jgi:hypothetical protein